MSYRSEGVLEQELRQDVAIHFARHGHFRPSQHISTGTFMSASLRKRRNGLRSSQMSRNGVVYPTCVSLKPDDRGEFINPDAGRVDAVLNGACVSVTYQHATEHYLAIVDG